MLTDEIRDRLHMAICSYASLTNYELALVADCTTAEAREYKQEQKAKILAAAAVDEDAYKSFHIRRL